MNSYYHIINFQKSPAKGYGIAVDEKGIVKSVPYDMRDIDWMVGRSIEEIKKRVGENNVCVSINDLIKKEDGE